MGEPPFIALLANALPPPPEWWPTVERDLGAPFPWFGGKRRIADLVWDRFGDVTNYVEPMAGSLAVLLGRPHAPTIETVNDADGHLVNLWRSIQADPKAVAHYADGPVFELDLHARHRYLTRLRGKLAGRLLDDPTYCNPMIAGWWIWGLCAWIGGGWCAGSASAKLPLLTGGAETERPQHGKGVHARGMRAGQNPDLAGSTARGEAFANHGKGIHASGMRLPMLGAGSGGQDDHACAHHGRGVHGAGMRAVGQLPSIGSMKNAAGTGGDGSRGINTSANRSRLPEVFAALSNRLRYVRVTCGDFERILSPAVTWRHGLTGVLLDPPYPPDAGLTGKLYAGTREEREVFDRSFRWALANGQRSDMRIAFCYYDGTKTDGQYVSTALRDAGWDVVAWASHGGYGGQNAEGNANKHRERAAFSPTCLRARQGSLF